MDSSSLSSIMKGVGGCVVGYEFTRFALSLVCCSLERMVLNTRCKN